MAKSFLFPGQDREHLNPIQRQLETLYDQVDRPGSRLTPAQFFQSPTYGQFLDSQYGSLSSAVPPGAQVVSQTPFEIRYRDAEGYETVISRTGAGAAEGGGISRQSTRPAVLPQQIPPEIQAALSSITGLTDRLSQPVRLAEIDPQTRAALQAQSDAEVAALNQQFQDAQGQLLARVYGQGVQRSTVANDAIARILQQQGLVRQQQQSDAALRGLQVQTALTEEERNRLNAALSGLANVAQTGVNLQGQQTQRDIASAGYGLDAKRLEESTRQFNAGNALDALRAQIEQEKLDQERGPLATAQRIAQLAATLTGGAGAGVKAYDDYKKL